MRIGRQQESCDAEMALKRSGQDAFKDLYHEAVSSSRHVECGGVIEVKCSGGDALYVSPAVLSVIMPWIKQGLISKLLLHQFFIARSQEVQKGLVNHPPFRNSTESVPTPQDLLGAWPECSLIIPDMRKRSLEELLERLFDMFVAPSKTSIVGIKESVDCLRIPLDVGSMDQSSVVRVRVQLTDLAFQCFQFPNLWVILYLYIPWVKLNRYLFILHLLKPLRIRYFLLFGVIFKNVFVALKKSMDLNTLTR